MVTSLATEDGMNEYLIWCLNPPKVMSMMALLSTGFLAALLPQALKEDEQNDQRKEANYYYGYLWIGVFQGH